MNYLDSIRDFFQSPKWFTNLFYLLFLERGGDALTLSPKLHDGPPPLPTLEWPGSIMPPFLSLGLPKK